MELHRDIQPNIETLNQIKEYLLFIAWTALWVCTLSNADYQKKNSANSPNRLDVEEGKLPKSRGDLLYECMITEVNVAINIIRGWKLNRGPKEPQQPNREAAFKVNSYELSGTELNLTNAQVVSQPLVLKLIPRIFEHLSDSLQRIILIQHGGNPFLSAIRRDLYIQGSDIRKFIITEVWKAASTAGAVMTKANPDSRLDLTDIILKKVLTTKSSGEYFVDELTFCQLQLELASFIKL